MRVFAALPIRDPGRAAIISLLDELRQSDWPVRWVRTEGIHLTLKFYGEVMPERLDVIQEAVRFAAAGARPIPLKLPHVGPSAGTLDRAGSTLDAGAAPGPPGARR